MMNVNKLGALSTRRGGRSKAPKSGTEMNNPADLMVDPTRADESDETMKTSKYLDPNYGHKTNLLSITDKISKALQDFDTLYTADEEADELLNAISGQVDELEGTPLKYQMKTFINKYKDMSAHMEDVNAERNEVLSSLADWFSADHLNFGSNVLSMDETEMNQNDKEVREGLLSAKLGFDKLQKLNDEIAENNARGRETTHLELEKGKMQQNVIHTFKRYKDLAVQEERVQKTEKEVWKFAATEICGLLHKVRDEGTEYLEELEKRMLAMVKNSEEQADFVKRIKAELNEKTLMEKKWKEDNSIVVEEKAMALTKVVKLKRLLKKTRKSLSNYEHVPKSQLEDNDDDEPVAEEIAPQPSQIQEKTDASETFILNKKLKGFENTISVLKSELEEAAQKQDKLLGIIKQQDEALGELQNDNTELLAQMKKNSIRPQLPRTGSQGRQSPTPVAKFRDSITGIAVKSKTSVVTDPQMCVKCGGSIVSPPVTRTSSSMSQRSAVLTKTSEITVAVQVRKEEKQRAGSPVPCKKCEGLQQSVKDMQKLLADANQEIGVLKHMAKQREIEPATDIYSGNPQTPTRNPQTPTRNQEVQPTTNTAPAPVQIINETRNEVSAVHEEKEIRIIPTTKEEIIVCHRGIQTDPRMDPLTGWAQPPERKGHRRSLVPPENWMSYDPTPGAQSTFALKDTIAASMLSGAEPTEVAEETEDVSYLVFKELERMIAGIQGFVEYTHSIIDKEARLMSIANKKLKENLSDSEQLALENQIIQERSPKTLARRISILHDKRKGGETRKLGHVSTELALDISNWTDVRKVLVPLEDHLKKTVDAIASEAINVLKKMHALLAAGLQGEHQQYEHMFDTFQEKGSFPVVDVAKVEKDLQDQKILKKSTTALETKRSLSHNDLLSYMDEQDIEERILLGKGLGGGGKGMMDQHQLRAKRSKSGLAEKVGFEATYDGTDMSEGNKKAFAVSKATIPKTGLIQLTTGGTIVPPEDTNMRGNTRKVKPAPLNRNKLMQRQNTLLSGTSNKRKRKDSIVEKMSHVKSTNQPKDVRKSYELPDDFFAAYTMFDLEKKAEEMKENQAQEQRITTHFLNAPLFKRADPVVVENEQVTLPKLQRSTTPEYPDVGPLAPKPLPEDAGFQLSEHTLPFIV